MSTQARSDATAGDGRSRSGLVTAWRRAQRGWPASSPIVQFPNAPVLVAGGGLLVAALTDGPAHDLAHATFYAGLSAWAWLELTAGESRARRVLGAAGLVYVVLEVGEALGA
jgi:hypothetical protein